MHSVESNKKKFLQQMLQDGIMKTGSVKKIVQIFYGEKSKCLFSYPQGSTLPEDPQEFRENKP
jgi:hypothetical protein